MSVTRQLSIPDVKQVSFLLSRVLRLLTPLYVQLGASVHVSRLLTPLYVQLVFQCVFVSRPSVLNGVRLKQGDVQLLAFHLREGPLQLYLPACVKLERSDGLLFYLRHVGVVQLWVPRGLVHDSIQQPLVLPRLSVLKRLHELFTLVQHA